MAREKADRRRLQAMVDAKGKIVSWRCSECNWSSLAENSAIIEKPQLIFDKHSCREHLRNGKPVARVEPVFEKLTRADLDS